MKSDALKKNHFWILAGVAPLFALLAALLVWSNVGAAIQTESDKIEKKLKEAKGVSPKGKEAIEKGYPAQKEELLAKRKQLWQVQWDRQRALFAWPNDPGLQQLSQQYVKFGTPIPNVEALDAFTKPEVYDGAYEEIATLIRPTTFPGGRWQSVLRHVSEWPRRPEGKQVWLALEDLWVQKGLLTPVKAINEEAAKFELVRPVVNGQPTDPPPLKRTFTTRIWQLDLEVPTTGPNANKVILAKLTNRTGRLQTLGTGPRGQARALWLNVWLSDNGPPIRYSIQGSAVKGGAVINITDKEVNPRPGLQGIPPGTNIQKIARVEQQLDDQTTPVRMVKNIELGWKDSRHGPATLLAPAFMTAPEVATSADTTAGGASGSTGSMPAGPSEGMGMAPGMSGGGMPMPGGGMPGMAGGLGTGKQRAKFGTPEMVLNANKDRYLQTTDQVRRMPVAVVLIVDQMFMQDALVAYANSPLRLQITQYHWARFRGDLPTTPGSMDTSGGAGGGFFPEMAAGVGDELGSESSNSGYQLPSTAGYGGSVQGSMGSMPTPSMPTPGGGSYGPSGAMSGYPGMMGGSYPGMMGGMMGGSMYNSPAAGQTNSGLVEVAIYGIVTLYEQYKEEKAPTEGSPNGTATPETPGATGTTPAPTTTGATPPMPPANGTTPATTPQPQPGVTPPVAPVTGSTPPAAPSGTPPTPTTPPPSTPTPTPQSKK